MEQVDITSRDTANPWREIIMDNRTVVVILSKVMEEAMVSQCTAADMASLKEDQAAAWALAEVQHSVLVLVCLEEWQSVAWWRTITTTTRTGEFERE
jgi:hypothetical protein